MSLYGGTHKGLNEYEPDGGFYCQNCSRVLVEQQGGVCAGCAAVSPDPQPDPTAAANAALEVVINPTSLITDAAASPSLPWPIAVIGFCVVGMIWANYLDGGRKK